MELKLKLANEVIFNLTREKKSRMDLSIKFAPGIDFEKIKKLVFETTDPFEECLKDPPPRVGIDAIDNDGFTVTINVWINSHGYQDIRLEFNEKLTNNLNPLFTKNKETD